MFANILCSLAGLVVYTSVASAHFRLTYPAPRGVFVSKDEVLFCGGYNNAASNRSDFPLNSGFMKLNNSHPEWTSSVLISIDQNPTDFAAFNKSSSGVNLPYAVPFFSTSGAGEVCIPVNAGALNISGVGDGSNATLQVMIVGGDGNLFQCADVTLRENFSTPSDVTCPRTVNGTTDTATSTTTSPSVTNTSSAQQVFGGVNGLLGLLITAIFSML